MSAERFHQLPEPQGSGSEPQRRSSDRLAALRQRSEHYARAAREAIDRVKALGETDRQLENLKNVSAQ